MTEKEFIETKSWIEKVINVTFDGSNYLGDESELTPDGAYFSKVIPGTKNVIELYFNDGECRLALFTDNRQVIGIYKTNDRNAHQCVSIFNFIYWNN